MSNQQSPDFYLQVEDFILRSISENTHGDNELNNEIGIFLFSLLLAFKKEHLD